MKTSIYAFTLFVLTGTAALFTACSKKDNSNATEQIQGTPGNPRFNLQFTNKDNADMDLRVLTPNGSEIYWNQPSGQNGVLDLDCQCAYCPNGANENIYWTPGNSMSPVYSVNFDGTTSVAMQPTPPLLKYNKGLVK
ncbi:MAG: hypothetical protein QM640_11995 [Niabella sp.]